MATNTWLLQIVNKIFYITPLTRWYRLRAKLLRLAGVECALTARIVASAQIVIPSVVIGENTFIGHQVLISGDAHCRIRIGCDVDIAPRVLLLSGTHVIDMLGSRSAGTPIGADVSIQNGVWLGAGCIILPGVTIGEKAVIGAGSVVTHDIPPYCIAVGNPCRPIKKWNISSLSFDREHL